MNDNFANLHCHTEYSILDSVGRVEEFIDKCAELGQKSIAFTEHGNMNSFLVGYVYAKKKGIKIIPGIEAYIVDDMSKKSIVEMDKGDEKDKKKIKQERKKKNHIVLLAKNQAGYKNLLKISSLGYIDGFYYKPRVDLKLIEKYKEGIIVLSSCIFGIISEKILHSNEEDLIKTIMLYKNIFKDDFYLEIQPHNFKDQIIVNKKIIELSRKYNIKLVATNDVHYVNREDYLAHRAIIMLNMKTTVSKIKKERLESNVGFHIKNRNEIYEDFVNIMGDSYKGDIKEALDNTIKISDSINVEIDLNKYRLPILKDIDVDKILKEIINKRWKDIKKIINVNLIPEYKKRIKMEYEILKDKNLLDFIYIIYDLVNWAKHNNILVGGGRGSSAASLLCYLLDITKIDPVKHDLLFSRFLNKNRKEFPDIDIDFDSRYRDKIKQYLNDKYGNGKVASIGAFGTFKSRGLLRDLARVFEKPLWEIDKIAKSIPFDSSLREASSIEGVKEFFDNNKDLYSIALRLEGQIRHFSTHAAGIVISNKNIYDDIPLCVYRKEIITGWGEASERMRCISIMNMMKLDCLGLSTLSVIADTINLVKKRQNKNLYDFLFYKLPLNDRKVLSMADRGETTGIFQFDGNSMKRLLRDIGIQNFEHLVAANALHRPAALISGFANEYVMRKNRKKNVKYIHPLLEKPLKRSFGLAIFQEDSMRIAHAVAKYSYDDADDLRKVTSKGKKLYDSGQGHLFDDAKNKFIMKCKENNILEDKAREIFKFMEQFSNYSFNRAHAVSYSFLSYQCLYLKTYFPLEYMVSLLKNTHNEEDVIKYIFECKRMGIKVLKPDINSSDINFSIDSGNVRFGLFSIKNIGEKAAAEIINKKPYSSYEDFIIRTEKRVVNKRVVDALIKAGCFNKICIAEQIKNYQEIRDTIIKDKKKNKFTK